MTILPSYEDRIAFPNLWGWDPSRVIDQRVVSDVPVHVKHERERAP